MVQSPWEGTPSAAEPPADKLGVSTSASTSRRTSKGRQKRVIDASIPREKVLHPLDEGSVPPELWNDPRAKRFLPFRSGRGGASRGAGADASSTTRKSSRWTTKRPVTSRLLAASAPKPLIDRCYVGVALLAYLAASRFADHIPYYREEDILARVGLSIHRATQWRWMRALAAIVLPLVELIRQRTMQSLGAGDR